MGRRLLLAAAVMALVWAAPAGAATISLVPGEFGGVDFRYTAAPGERNVTTALALRDSQVAQPGGYSTVVIQDLGATITASAPGCTVLGSVATCRITEVAAIIIDLGDGNDRGTLEGGMASLRGGPGDDALHLVGVQDITLGFDSSQVQGGPGSDTMTTVPILGNASVSYIDHVSGVTVTLDGKRNDGSPGENDLVGDGFRVITGSPAADELHGNDGFNVISAGAGDDRIFGNGDADLLIAGEGSDTIDAGSGADTVLANELNDFFIDRFLVRDGEVDTVVCSGGRDTAVADAIDRFPNPVCSVELP